MQKDLTPEQILDVEQRVDKALAYLKELNLTPAAQLFPVKLDVEDMDVFGTRVIPYLQDIKYSGNSIPSPFVPPK